MEFLDEDARPRFVFQSGAGTGSGTEPQLPYNKPTKRLLFLAFSLSSLLFALSFFFFQSEPFKSLLFWFSLSLLVGPFAPISLTGGDVRVGQGHIVQFPDQERIAAADDDAKKRGSQRRSKIRRSEELPAPAVVPVVAVSNGGASEKIANGNGVTAVEEEKEWREEDIAILKKQMAKNPVGKPRRWEVIAEAFGGRHKAESVIKKAKELGEKRVDDSESYAEFLKKRKAVDKRAVNEDEGEVEDSAVEKNESGWSSVEDIALLNALKAFPKDVSMRWEKVAAAVPGKSKAACIKRVAELKKGFRTAKSAPDG